MEVDNGSLFAVGCSGPLRDVVIRNAHRTTTTTHSWISRFRGAPAPATIAPPEAPSGPDRLQRIETTRHFVAVNDAHSRPESDDPSPLRVRWPNRTIEVDAWATKRT